MRHSQIRSAHVALSQRPLNGKKDAAAELKAGTRSSKVFINVVGA
jgi:hypothetical protein